MAATRIAGWREFVSLPEWDIARVRAKLDTGARISAIDVGAIEALENGRIRFEVIYRDRPRRRVKWVEADAVREATIKPSNGERLPRAVVKTVMELAGVRREIEIGLVRRSGMLCRMLIGRHALAPDFVVDSGAKYRLTSPKRPMIGRKGLKQ